MSIETNNNIEEKKVINFEGLNANEIWQGLYNKELNCKKNILEYIEITKVLKSDDVKSSQIQDTYTLIYTSIDKMNTIIKPNTIMHLKNQLKAQLGKHVENRDPKEINHFIEFFKEAYPRNDRRKGYMWVIMDPSKITEDQIWTTLAYINGWCLQDCNRLHRSQTQDIVEMVELLVSKNRLKYTNQVKSLSKLLNILQIKVVPFKDGFKVMKASK
ncbi:hypothetical protein [Clostridium gasigenes]|uniref:Uncharacterized protein n=1 Tax=Clostridium gasigenes TaxID=94869 RepID=A0A1H0SM55_9CLOT|nr:hypothetical protein [Clostridium gasigenes]MBB6715402.1 hypothetical protein [Clostridium gasigenes]MBU3108596.1 hypothetical protein [Clostridium gasigenes]MBU3137223.1 hypothetical protein [Clostridium gasigenes]QSW20442.1 hypothetical protein J1C67_04510 [Clostridium gasigenes]SDP42814.1 hypothetical protein SAMN04488529_105117 [Clostridium gasigenes]